MVVEHERYDEPCTGRVEAGRVGESQRMVTIVDAHGEAAEQLESNHAIDVNSLDARVVDRRDEPQLVVQLHGADGDLIDPGEATLGGLLARAGHRRRTHGLQTNCRGEAWADQIV